VVTDVLQLEATFNTFQGYLRQIARDARQVLSEFPQPPAFDLWNNPVADRSHSFDSFATGARLISTSLLFQASNADGLCCDGNRLLDAGISASRRLWLMYQYDSLTEFDGTTGYTSIFVLVTVVVGERETVVHVGFDWLNGDRPSRLTFDASESKIQASVLNRKWWRVLHELKRPTHGLTIETTCLSWNYLFSSQRQVEYIVSGRVTSGSDWLSQASTACNSDRALPRWHVRLHRP